MPTVSTEDYIKTVFKLEEDGVKATTSALAAQLDVADASITEMIKKLSDKGLLRYERYQGVRLTPKGKKMALGILRRHRLWEMYLVRFLGYSWDEVHDEAERLEHVTSNDLEHRLDKALGFPAADPHGDPIPTENGELLKTEFLPLSDHEAGDAVIVCRVSDGDSEILQHATSLGIGLSSRIVIREKKSFDGSMVVSVGTKRHFISKQVAKVIFVQPA